MPLREFFMFILLTSKLNQNDHIMQNKNPMIGNKTVKHANCCKSNGRVCWVRWVFISWSCFLSSVYDNLKVETDGKLLSFLNTLFLFRLKLLSTIHKTSNMYIHFLTHVHKINNCLPWKSKLFFILPDYNT